MLGNKSPSSFDRETHRRPRLPLFPRRFQGSDRSLLARGGRKTESDRSNMVGSGRRDESMASLSSVYWRRQNRAGLPSTFAHTLSPDGGIGMGPTESWERLKSWLTLRGEYKEGEKETLDLAVGRREGPAHRPRWPIQPLDRMEPYCEDRRTRVGYGAGVGAT